MRLKIITEDEFVSIDEEGIHGLDMTWIPEFIGESGISTSVHAVQWYGDHGEIELNSRDNNIFITELGVFEEAIVKYEERKEEILAAKVKEELEELERLKLQTETGEFEGLLDIEEILKELRDEEDTNVGIATT